MRDRLAELVDAASAGDDGVLPLAAAAAAAALIADAANGDRADLDELRVKCFPDVAAPVAPSVGLC